ncbi:MAG: diguanylate cyclase [Sulfuritalea sp.]|nr:diguanylate cyclase [Sulfuritalea sp.]MCF8184147.1 diguanylate cyclase [Polynucleobacter sp.]
MAETTKLSEIEVARETLRRLAMTKVPPTPDNYRALYFEISGAPATTAFPEREFKAVLAALPRANQEQNRFSRQLEAAIADGNWDGVGALLKEFIGKLGSEQSQWPGLIRDLLHQLDTHHAGLTAAKKKEALDHVLSVSGTPELLLTRLLSLIRSWALNPAAEKSAASASSPASTPTSTPAPATATATATGVTPAAATPSAAPKAQTAPPAWAGGIVELREIIAQLLDNTLSIILRDKPDLARETAEISAAVKAAKDADALNGLSERLKKLCYRAHFIAEDQAEISTGLIHLVQLIMENISELVVEDQWLSGQIDSVRELVLQPLDLRRLDDVERRMKDVIVKQSSLKQNLNEAKNRLKTMLSTFVDRLAGFSETTSDYHGKIEVFSHKISKAHDISELTDVLDEVMRETRIVQIDAARSRDELNDMRNRVIEAEQIVSRLQDELSSASELVRHDALTGVLNRKGLDEALEKEISRLQRQGGMLSLAMLDIDNFKKLNDTLGHFVGDAALVHLASVVQETIRPQDTLARYGGEEFVVLLPSTSMTDAVAAMTRVQRELTRRFFLNKNEKILITFSCGVAETRIDEDPYETLKRADAAMYLAKRAGKNRVVPA